MKSFIKKHIWHILTGLAVILVLFMHIYKITEIPYGLNVDEASGAYDALNIVNYGVDRHLKSYPLYFTNYSDGQNALYIYSTALLIRIFGISKTVIRATAVLGALWAAFFGWSYMKSEMPERKGNLIWLVLYAIIPVFTMTQRFGLESHLLLPLSMISLFFVAKAIDTDKWKFYLLAGFTLGITLYTYALSYIVIPLFLIFTLIYVIAIKRFCWKKVLASCAVLAIFAFPLIMIQLINYFDLPEMNIGPFTLTKLQDYRINEVAGMSVWDNLKTIFSTIFLYDDLPYNTSAKYGTFFYFSIPFILFGFGKCIYDGILSVKKKSFSYSVPMVFWFIAELIMGSVLSGNSVPNSTRMIGIYIPMLYFLVKALMGLWDIIKKNAFKKVFIGIVSLCYAVSFLHFAVYYFTDYNEDAFPMKWLFYESYDDVGDFLSENTDASWYDRSTVYPWNYVYYLLEYQINPYDFNLPLNGRDRFGKDYINEFPPEILLQCNYVIYRTDGSSQEYLKAAGYEEHKTGDNFFFYVSPLDSYIEKQSPNVNLTIDKLSIQGDYIVFNGWCADSTTLQAFEKMYLEIDNQTYDVLQSERPDVAAVLGSEGNINYGFYVTLPTDIFYDTDCIRLIGTDSDGQEEIYSFNRE